jgi:translation initiation factor 3 subunit H
LTLQKRRQENEERKKNGLPLLPPNTPEEIQLNALVEPSRLDVETALAAVKGCGEGLEEMVKGGIVKMYGVTAGIDV